MAHRNSWSHSKWWFSIVFSMFTRGYSDRWFQGLDNDVENLCDVLEGGENLGYTPSMLQDKKRVSLGSQCRYGRFLEWGDPNTWIFYNGKSQSKMDDLGGTPISGSFIAPCLFLLVNLCLSGCLQNSAPWTDTTIHNCWLLTLWKTLEIKSHIIVYVYILL